MPAPRLSIIVPTYNEQDNVPALIARVSSALGTDPSRYELLIVDDDSPDGTWRVAEVAQATHTQVRVIRRTTGERGLAPAVIEGWARARGEWIGVMDADLQHPPETWKPMLEALEGGADVVVATRYAQHGSTGRWNLARKFLSRGASNLAQAVLPAAGQGVTDPMSGFFALHRRVIEGVALRAKGYKILLEVLSRGRYGRVVEVPYAFGLRYAGYSKLGMFVMRDYLVQLARLVIAPQGLGRFLRYCLVGGSGVAVNLFMLWFLKGSGLLGTLRAEIVAIEAALVNNFLWNECWTFRDRSRLHPQLRARLWRLASFNLVCGIGALFHFAGYWFLTMRVGWPYLPASLVAIVPATLWNYGWNTGWTWTAFGPPTGSARAESIA